MTLAIVLAALLTFALVRLAAMVRQDRPLTAPRSHSHEVDPAKMRLTGLY